MKGTDNSTTATHGLYAIECRDGVLKNAPNRSASSRLNKAGPSDASTPELVLCELWKT